MESLCVSCKGKGLCGKPCKILNSFIKNAPKPKLHFHGKSAPEVFVGRAGYPLVNSGILAPSENDNVSNFPDAKSWSENNFSVSNVLRLRGQLIYGKSKINIRGNNLIKKITQELAMSSKPVSTEIFLKKKPTLNFTADKIFSPMTNPAPIRKAILEENPKIPPKVDYLVSDSDAKAVDAMNELYKSNISVSHLQKILSVGLLGRKASRKMVPTRWSITATDDIISLEQLNEIRHYPEIDEILLFYGEFVGNHVMALVLPGRYSFEALEAWISGNFYAGEKTKVVQDYEGFYGRKEYALNVTGGYYAMRLPTTEFLKKIKRQATVLVFREIRPEYYAPLGVGIVREATRRAYLNLPKKFDNLNEALKEIDAKVVLSIKEIEEKSWVLNNYGKQKSLNEFIN